MPKRESTRQKKRTKKLSQNTAATRKTLTIAREKKSIDAVTKKLDVVKKT